MDCKNVLICHGWAHSAYMYLRLKNDIESLFNHNVVLYEFDGFGDFGSKDVETDNIFQYYVNKLKAYLNENQFDIIIGHSMGARVVLQAVDENKSNEVLMLIAPEYMGISRLKVLNFIPFVIKPVLSLLLHKCLLCDILIKVGSLLTINRYSKIDEQILIDFRRCNINVASSLLLELINDNWQLSKHNENTGLIIASSDDRIISIKKLLMLTDKMSRICFVQLNGIGHTALLEDYDRLLSVLSLIL